MPPPWSHFAQQLQTDAPAEGTPFSATVLWQGGFRNEIVVRDLPPTYADEPFALGGTNTASNPVEQILGALGSCLSIGYTAGAVARGITIDDLRIELTGPIDLPVFFGLKAGHAGYEQIDARVFIRVGRPEGRDRSAPFGRLPDLAGRQHDRAASGPECRGRRGLAPEPGCGRRLRGRTLNPPTRHTPGVPPMSTVLDEVLAANKAYADSFGIRSDLALAPARHLAFLTCMDARLDPAGYAGLKEGDAHVIRNAGGRASDDAIARW